MTPSREQAAIVQEAMPEQQRRALIAEAWTLVFRIEQLCNHIVNGIKRDRERKEIKE